MKLTAKFIAPILAGALALTSLSAIPARADSNDDFAAFMAAIIAMAVIADAAGNGNDTTYRPRRHDGRDEYRDRDRDRDGYATHRHNAKRHHHRHAHRAKLLPRTCLKNYRTRWGKEVFFSNNCLRNNFRGYARLPHSCDLRIRARNDRGVMVTRRVFVPRCLAQKGYRVRRG